MIAETIRSTAWRRGALLAMLAVIATGLLVSLAVATTATTSPTTSPADTGPSGPITVVAGPISGQTYGLYLVDEGRRTISVYQVNPKAKEKLILMAGRTYAFDVLLDDYNTYPPPREIKLLVQQHKRLEENP
jgi:hypothetical protein